MSEQNYTILVVDDSEDNRSMLIDILGGNYNIIQAEDGISAIEILEKDNKDIDMVLLDGEMPGMDGFDVLTTMNNKGWIETIPVIMVSSNNAQYSMRRAFGLGVIDYISRPFDNIIVRRKVINTLILYSKQKKLISMLVKQIYMREKSANLMTNILGHIVEFRNGNSGSHALNVGVITKMLLERMNKSSDTYNFSYDEILLISSAAALHDIGKITIPDEIVYKPGKLTEEEFELMKSHSAAGVLILDEMTSFNNEDLIKCAKEVCMSHHERYDGKGYPNGLKGDEIPISAQVIGLADAYDVLTSERLYKNAYGHENAVQMILNGECGAFNPFILECFKEEADNIYRELRLNPLNRNIDKEIRRIMGELLEQQDMLVMEQVIEEMKK